MARPDRWAISASNDNDHLAHLSGLGRPLKFGLVVAIAVSLSFTLDNLIRRLPYTDRVL